MNRREVERIIGEYEPLLLEAGEAKRAAVLVPLSGTDDRVEVVLTRRTEEISDHPGQVAFPGGGIKSGDATPAAAALREAHEELGIPPDEVELMGALDEAWTVTGFHVVPIVGWIQEGIELSPSPREVARVFSVPLDELMREQRWQRHLHVWQGNELWVWHFPHDGEDVWGATARMLRNMIELLRREAGP